MSSTPEVGTCELTWPLSLRYLYLPPDPTASARGSSGANPRPVTWPLPAIGAEASLQLTWFSSLEFSLALCFLRGRDYPFMNSYPLPFTLLANHAPFYIYLIPC